MAAGASPKQIASWAGHTSVAVVLDRYGHLFPGHEDAVLDRLDGFAGSPSVTAMTVPDATRPWGAAGFSRGNAVDGSHRAPVMGSDQDFYRGRWGFRTLDLCRVKAALSR